MSGPEAPYLIIESGFAMDLTDEMVEGMGDNDWKRIDEALKQRIKDVKTV